MGNTKHFIRSWTIIISELLINRVYQKTFYNHFIFLRYEKDLRMTLGMTCGITALVKRFALNNLCQAILSLKFVPFL